MKNYIIFVVAISVSYVVGRYTAPEKIVTHVETVEVEKVVNKTERKKIHYREDPDGMIDAVIIIDSNTEENTFAASTTEETEIPVQDEYNVSVMAGGGLPLSTPIFGASIQKRFIGPITLGVWGLSNKTGGVSVGFSF